MAGIISLQEIIDIIVMTAFVGFIFKDAFMPRIHYQDVLDHYTRKKSRYWDSFIYAIMAAVPAIVLHEFGHKFVALGFGMSAVFHAAYFWLGLGLVLKLLNFGFIFLVPAFVTISGNGTYLQHALVAFAGPAVNLLLWGISKIAVDRGIIGRKYLPVAVVSRKINIFLFFFNMLPIPPFDGYTVFYGLFRAIFG